ncbi:hypothetical protein C8R42DRAFT_118529 [Lentinula raphanica]|nr:hypothetical protein C8R42DRAFT_118529 [Lentinula raphanica]KAJ3818330.1 hypothetical protein F5880DRAFT_1256918 [Lentinula raphanica]
MRNTSTFLHTRFYEEVIQSSIPLLPPLILMAFPLFDLTHSPIDLSSHLVGRSHIPSFLSTIYYLLLLPFCLPFAFRVHRCRPFAFIGPLHFCETNTSLPPTLTQRFFLSFSSFSFLPSLSRSLINRATHKRAWVFSVFSGEYTNYSLSSFI